MANKLVSLEEDPIVVTGVGCVTPLGHSAEATWQNLVAGEDGFVNLRKAGIFDEAYDGIIKAEVAAPTADFDLKNNPLFDNVRSRKKFSDWHRSTQMGLHAAAEAASQADILVRLEGETHFRLDGDQIDTSRVAIFNGSGMAGATELISVHERIATDRPVKPSMTMTVLPERVASVLSMELGSHGPLASLIGACATGNMNIVNGAWALELGQVDLAIVGGTEAPILPEAMAMFDGVGAMDRTQDTKKVSRPFHQDARGFTMGEGAGVLVLERESHARRRGAAILAILAGHGWTSDAYHNTFPHPDGTYQAIAINQALEMAEQFIEGDGYVNAHGTGTAGDNEELNAMSKSRLPLTGSGEILVSSTKSAMGHLIGAASAVESILCVLALRNNVAPGTLRFDPEDAVEAASNWRIISEATHIQKLGWAVNNSFGFGGFNAVTVFTQPTN